MQTDWILGLMGGALIGTAGAIFLLINGRIMGASGIIGGLIDRTGLANASERLAFLAGLVIIPLIALPFTSGMSTHLTGNLAVVVIAGLLVGIGTRIANGCTSGHGVCGISRLSPRGIAATAVYILAGAITVVLFRHVIGVV
jgi:uncharacterized membrane protein YedE/YeeE